MVDIVQIIINWIVIILLIGFGLYFAIQIYIKLREQFKELKNGNKKTK